MLLRKRGTDNRGEKDDTSENISNHSRNQRKNESPRRQESGRSMKVTSIVRSELLSNWVVRSCKNSSDYTEYVQKRKRVVFA